MIVTYISSFAIVKKSRGADCGKERKRRELHGVFDDERNLMKGMNENIIHES
jgi:hypothetical protein